MPNANIAADELSLKMETTARTTARTKMPIEATTASRFAHVDGISGTDVVR